MQTGPLLAVLCSCTLCPLACTLILAVFYYICVALVYSYNAQQAIAGTVSAGDLADIAANANIDLTDIADNPFDRCGTEALPDILNTGWYTAFALNASVYTLLTVFTCCISISALLWPLAFCGGCGICLTGIIHMVAIIITGVYRYNADGVACSEREVQLDLLDTNADALKWSDVGTTLH